MMMTCDRIRYSTTQLASFVLNIEGSVQYLVGTEGRMDELMGCFDELA